MVDLDPVGYQGLSSRRAMKLICRVERDNCLVWAQTFERKTVCWSSFRACMADLDRSRFLKWYEREQDTSWCKSLPDCPCKIIVIKVGIRIGQNEIWVQRMPVNPDRKIWNNPSQPRGGFHKAATWCMRSKPTTSGTGQQCCYDERGKLITRGEGAGTADRSAPFQGHHFDWDMDPAWLAKKLDEKYCGSEFCEFGEKYQNVRPINKGKNCENPPLNPPPTP